MLILHRYACFIILKPCLQCLHAYSVPLLTMVGGPSLFLIAPLLEPQSSMLLITPIDAVSPFGTPPKTTWRPSSQEVTTVVTKNCEPLVFGPALAMERRNGLLWVSLKFSSANFSP